jgi:3-oxo-5-alpha-steroid 4-dehydrogenase 1
MRMVRMITMWEYNWCVLFWITVAIAVFFILLRIPAPYGKTARKGWGPLVNSRYGWVFMESSAFGSFLILFLLGERGRTIVGIVFFLLWEIHYIHRAFIYPFRIKGGEKKMALSVVLMGFSFNVINGCVNGIFLFFLSRPYSLSWLYDLRFIGGILLFGVGFAISSLSDTLLRRIRKGGSSAYEIPKGFLFTYISCPNYFGEIIEWLGWALLTWSFGGVSFLVWTCANLIPRAITYHEWYRKKFPNYPKERKAVIPFLL